MTQPREQRSLLTLDTVAGRTGHPGNRIGTAVADREAHGEQPVNGRATLGGDPVSAGRPGGDVPTTGRTPGKLAIPGARSRAGAGREQGGGRGPGGAARAPRGTGPVDLGGGGDAPGRA